MTLRPFPISQFNDFAALMHPVLHTSITAEIGIEVLDGPLVSYAAGSKARQSRYTTFSATLSSSAVAWVRKFLILCDSTVTSSMSGIRLVRLETPPRLLGWDGGSTGALKVQEFSAWRIQLPSCPSSVAMTYVAMLNDWHCKLASLEKVLPLALLTSLFSLYIILTNFSGSWTKWSLVAQRRFCATSARLKVALSDSFSAFRQRLCISLFALLEVFPYGAIVKHWCSGRPWGPLARCVCFRQRQRPCFSFGCCCSSARLHC